MAKKQLDSQKDAKLSHKNKILLRKSTIDQWRERVANKEDEGLSLVILKACQEMGILDIGNATYHKLATVLKRLVVDEQEKLASISVGKFVENFGSFCEVEDQFGSEENTNRGSYGHS